MMSSFFFFYFKVKRSILPICEDRSEYLEWFALVGFFSSRLCRICYATLYDRILLYVNFLLWISL